MARTQSTEWFERGEREAHEAHVRHAKGHHDDHDDHRSTAAAHSAADLDAHHHPHRRPAWLIPVLGAAVVVLLVIAIVKMAGRETAAKPYGSNVAQAKADARVENAPAADAAELAAVAIDAPDVGSAQVAGSALRRSRRRRTGSAQLAAVVPDAAVVAVPVDAAEVAAVPVDAAKIAAVPVDAAQVATVPRDAAQVAAVPVDAAPKVEHTTRHDHTDTTKTDHATTDKPKVEEKPESIEDLYAAGNFPKANQACAKNTQFNASILEMCAVTACQVKDTALATRWIRAIARSSRDALIGKCKDLGVEITPP